jgi:hypothetical protein
MKLTFAFLTTDDTVDENLATVVGFRATFAPGRHFRVGAIQSPNLEPQNVKNRTFGGFVIVDNFSSFLTKAKTTKA